MKHLQFFSSLIYLLLIIGCNSCTTHENEVPCPTVRVTNFNFDSYEKSRIPYSGTDTIILVNNSGDTALFIGTGKQVSFEQYNAIGAQPNCEADKEVYERNAFTFIDSVHNLTIDILHRENTFTTYLTFKGIKWATINSHVGRSSVSNYRATYTVGSNTYHDVNLLQNDFTGPNVLVYNASEGIIQINLPSGERWDLLK